MTKPKVAILRTDPKKVLPDIERLFELGDGPQFLSTQAPTILKDNISWHYPFPSANTTPWQLEGTILALRKYGFQDISCVQNKTEVTNAHKGERLNLYTPIFSAHDIPVLYNFKQRDMSWIPYRPKAVMLALNKIYPQGLRIPDYFIGKNILHLPTTKCHIYTQTTGALKNAFGGLLNHKRHQTHSVIHETLVDLLAIQKEIHPGLFCIMDGTTAGNGPGPRIMKPFKKDILLASADQVAVDAVAAKIMGFEPMEIKYLRLAQERGLGTAIMDDIDIVGDSEIIHENWGFKVGYSFHKFAGWVTWFGPTSFLQDLFTKPPLLYLGNFYSFFYHDVLHWPFQEKKIYQAWLQESPWGQLFEAYRKQGVLGKGGSDPGN
jgi:uncharacterized protein (DUF362 family)